MENVPRPVPRIGEVAGRSAARRPRPAPRRGGLRARPAGGGVRPAQRLARRRPGAERQRRPASVRPTADQRRPDGQRPGQPDHRPGPAPNARLIERPGEQPDQRRRSRAASRKPGPTRLPRPDSASLAPRGSRLPRGASNWRISARASGRAIDPSARYAPGPPIWRAEQERPVGDRQGPVGMSLARRPRRPAGPRFPARRAGRPGSAPRLFCPAR